MTADEASITIRRGRPPDPITALPPARRPGARLWLYTNFDCNLACDYCCARSSPQTARRALGVERVKKIAKAAPAAGVTEILLTGGEPFMLPDLDEIVAACTAALPTTLLTNGMLWRGHRLEMLQAMPRDRLTLQISLDSATPDPHDSHRGKGTWAKAVAGIRTALGEGFTVRVAATLTTDDRSEERQLRSFLDALGIARENQVVRPLAHQGAADTGVELTVETLVPEVTITADGVYWHPVGADDDEQLVTRDIFPLDAAIDLVREQYRNYRNGADAAARTFPCA
ncbi:radical SAM protein [Streptomyces sp. NPDC048551]|uniref:Rv1681 family radical SAM protein n=1 Tax=Streptomyces sp. NPDC048551 TaxID=3155758 RepID=UPI00343B1798